MTNFVTYAQNFEDVLLWRALNAVKEGFYIDVGAADPDEDSVTRAFYDRGWHGINIEPAPSYFSALLGARPRDVTLQCLVGAQRGEAELHHFLDTGLSTINPIFAARHAAEGREYNSMSLPVLPLAEICQRYAPETVHFLKIDVEGAEAEVLRGADLHSFRPWIILAEATEPGSRTENWFDWEEILTNADYRFVWFDGLNRFYLASEHWEALHGAFKTPPNVFDQWIQPRGKQQRALIDRGVTATLSALSAANSAHEALVAALARTEALSTQLTAAQTDAGTARSELIAREAHVSVVEKELADLSAQMAARTQAVLASNKDLIAEREAREQIELAYRSIRESTFWRATAPMRRMVTAARRLLRRAGVKRDIRGATAPAPAGTTPAPEPTSMEVGSAEPGPSAPAEELRMQRRLHASTNTR